MLIGRYLYQSYGSGGVLKSALKKIFLLPRFFDRTLRIHIYRTNTTVVMSDKETV